MSPACLTYQSVEHKWHLNELVSWSLDDDDAGGGDDDNDDDDDKTDWNGHSWAISIPEPNFHEVQNANENLKRCMYITRGKTVCFETYKTYSVLSERENVTVVIQNYYCANL